ncbi:hypothetical protein N0V88_004384 [Collariella sp. IMI 366227]|nr:hypothetical protein N0V88_004384 [Collariella sp. IMI 366227]
MAYGGDLSPSKVARLIGFARQPHSHEAGEAGVDEGSGREEEEHHQVAHLVQHEHQASAQAAVEDLMSGVASELHRPQHDMPSDAGQSDIDAAAAAARALSSVTLPTGHVHTHPGADDLHHHVSPQSGTSGASLDDGEGHVVDSPGAMDVDSHHDDNPYAPQPEAQMEDKTGSSLSYPGAMPASGGPQRVMSMPMPTSQTPTLDLTPRSPGSNKKHKCPYCETEFTRHHNLKSHLLTHSQEKPYVCQSCNLRFRRLHDLKRHSKLHTGEKPHVCPSCDRKFARGDALARHSKGAGGCAGRRQTMGSFGLNDGSNVGSADNSGLADELYEGGGDMTEEERRRLSMPSIKAAQVAGHVGAESYGAGHSSTYPPAGPRPGVSGSLYPPNVDRGSSGSNTSPSGPNSHTPHTSVSSMPLSAGSASLYSQGGMTESPKPLSPRLHQHPQRVPTEQQQQQGVPGLSLPTHGNATAQGRERPRAASTTAPPASGGENNTFVGTDPGLWAYFQHLEGTVKKLNSQMEAEARGKAQMLETLSAHEQHIAALTAEVAALRQQQQQVGAAGPHEHEEASPADSAAQQQ